MDNKISAKREYMIYTLFFIFVVVFFSYTVIKRREKIHVLSQEDYFYQSGNVPKKQSEQLIDFLYKVDYFKKDSIARLVAFQQDGGYGFIKSEYTKFVIQLMVSDSLFTDSTALSEFEDWVHVLYHKNIFNSYNMIELHLCNSTWTTHKIIEVSLAGDKERIPKGKNYPQSLIGLLFKMYVLYPEEKDTGKYPSIRI